MSETPIDGSAGTADRVATAVLFVVYLVVGLFLAWYLLLVHNLSADNCRYTAEGCGAASTVIDLTNSLGMGLVLVVAVVVVVRRVRRRRHAWWVPVTAMLATVALFAVATLNIEFAMW